MSAEQFTYSVLIGFVSAAIAAVFTHFLLQLLGRKRALHMLICHRIDALEVRICGWLETLPSENQSVNHDAVQRRLFEIALARVEILLSAEQNRALEANCPNLRNLGETRQARRELEQLLQNTNALYKTVDRA